MLSISAIGLLFLVDWLHRAAAYKAVLCSHLAAERTSEAAQLASLPFDVIPTLSSWGTLIASPVESQ